MPLNKRDINCEDNALNARIIAKTKNINTATIVKVLSVDAGNKTVTVQPMVQKYDLNDQAVNEAIINDIPYIRLQGGGYGIVCDPVVGDIGLVAFCSRDISNIIKNKKISTPGSKRIHAVSDGVYIASLLLDEPTTFLKITQGGVEIMGDVTVNGTITATSDVKAGNISLRSHVHGNGNNGGNTGHPI